MTLTQLFEQLDRAVNALEIIAETNKVLTQSLAQQGQTGQTVSAEAFQGMLANQAGAIDFEDRDAVKKNLELRGIEYNVKCATATLAKLLKEKIAEQPEQPEQPSPPAGPTLADEFISQPTPEPKPEPPPVEPLPVEQTDPKATIEDARAALVGLVERYGLNRMEAGKNLAAQIIKDHGGQKLSDVDPGKFAGIVKTCNEHQPPAEEDPFG